MNIRPYSDSDERAVVRLWEKVFPEAPPWNIPSDDVRRKCKVQRELFFVAEIDSRLVGTAMAGYDGHRGWVYYVAVDPDYRRKGLGTALMDRVEKDLMDLGCPKLNLQVRSSNQGVVAFYRHLGYTIEDHISLGKLLRH